MKKDIKQAISEIIYQVLSWYEKDGSYIPTLEKAKKEIKKIIIKLLKN